MLTWTLFGLGCFTMGWLLGWLMGISRTTTIYRALMREGANPQAWRVLLAALLLSTPAWAQAPCTHYAAPNGSGSTCSEASPCRIGQWWGKASPGGVLCLNDGTYTDTITPPGHLKGTSSAPITIRARNDGNVLIDAQHGGFAVWLSGTSGSANHWFVVEGINAKNGLEAVYRVSGNDNILRRVIGWDGTSGQSDSNIFRLTGQRTLLEDCAGWGKNSRKIIDGAQAGNVQGSTVRRCWAEWNDWPGGQSWPINTYQMGYKTTNQLYENVLGTTDRIGDNSPGDHEGVMRGFRGGGEPPFDMEGTKLLGSLFYTTPGATNMGDSLLTTDEVANLYIEDFAAIVDSDRGESVTPWYMGSCIAPGHCTNNVCKNCLGVHDGRPGSAVSNSGWTFPGLRQGTSVAAATGGQSPFILMPMLCRRVVKGKITDTPLWPFPMDARIKEARIASGYRTVEVTKTVEQILGPIPAQCRTGGPPPTTDTTPPQVQLISPSHGAVVSGTSLVVSAHATDDSGTVVAIMWMLNGEDLFEQPGGDVSFTVNTTQHPDDQYELSARARDAAGNQGTSQPVTVTVKNAPQPQPPGGGNLQCTGTITSVPGDVTMTCTPVPHNR